MVDLVRGRLAKCPVWMIPMSYVAATLIVGFTLPRLEHAYWGGSSYNVSVSSAQAVFSSIASGMMALTGIVFSLQFVRVTFSAMAYSPRIFVLLARDPLLFHSLGFFIATFGCALAALAWTDREGLGKVPLITGSLVIVLLVCSMLSFGRLIQAVSDMQITRILLAVGRRGRQVVRDMFPLLEAAETEIIAAWARDAAAARENPPSQTMLYVGEPRVVAGFDIEALARLARQAEALIELECAVGDTLADGSVLLHVLATGGAEGGAAPIPELQLLRAVKLAEERTFEQDPKYAIRLLVDIAIRALSPAVNDPTTAVQAIDQIEDLLRRLGRRRLGAGYAGDAAGALRVIFPTPTWTDYLTLAFDEIRLYGATSLQVIRRLRSALRDLAEATPVPERRQTVQDYLAHLDLLVGRHITDPQDHLMAMQEDRQGLGLSR